MPDHVLKADERDVERIAPRLPDFERPPDPKLVAEGWERRFVTSVGRQAEYAELYASLGYEVRAEPVRPDEIDPACGDCSLIVYRQIVTIYTRKLSDESSTSAG